jgi:tRNA:m4X modification enzyme
MGAGKGQLAGAMRVALSRESSLKGVLVVDSGGFRRKQDGCFAQEEVPFTRLRIDIRDLNLSLVPQLSGRCAIVGKHLCGQCTDFALSCVTTHASNVTVRSLVIATCCHHRCEWAHCLGADEFSARTDDLHFSEQDFQWLASVSSWAVCGEAVTPAQQRLGVECKRVIDYMRVRYLERCGFEVSLHEYVSQGVTKENFCIVAHSTTTPRGVTCSP